MPEVSDYADDTDISIPHRRYKRRIEAATERAFTAGLLTGLIVMFVIYRAVEVTFS
jgi:hypothetical protein